MLPVPVFQVVSSGFFSDEKLDCISHLPHVSYMHRPFHPPVFYPSINVRCRPQPDPSQLLILLARADHRLTLRSFDFQSRGRFSWLNFSVALFSRYRSMFGFILRQSTATSFDPLSYSSFKIIVLFDKTADRGHMGKTDALYSGGIGFNSRCGMLLSWLRFLVGSPSSSGQVAALKLCHHRFIPQPFRFIIQ